MCHTNFLSVWCKNLYSPKCTCLMWLFMMWPSHVSILKNLCPSWHDSTLLVSFGRSWQFSLIHILSNIVLFPNNFLLLMWYLRLNLLEKVNSICYYFTHYQSHSYRELLHFKFIILFMETIWLFTTLCYKCKLGPPSFEEAKAGEESGWGFKAFVILILIVCSCIKYFQENRNKKGYSP